MVPIDESPLSWILKITSWWDHVLEKATYPVSKKAKRKMSWVALISSRGVPPVIQHLHKLPINIVPKPPGCFILRTKLLELWEEKADPHHEVSVGSHHNFKAFSSATRENL